MGRDVSNTRREVPVPASWPLQTDARLRLNDRDIRNRNIAPVLDPPNECIVTF